MSNQYDYIREDVDGYWNIDIRILSDEIEALFSDKTFTVGASGLVVGCIFDEELTSEEINNLDNLISSHKSNFDPLPQVKDKKILEIDNRTEELIFQGFAYNSKVFSLSLSAQIKILGAYGNKDNLGIYPIEWNTIDDLNTETLSDILELTDFYNQAFGTIKFHLDSGTAFKNSVRVATTVSGINAIIDNR